MLSSKRRSPGRPSQELLPSLQVHAPPAVANRLRPVSLHALTAASNMSSIVYLNPYLVEELLGREVHQWEVVVVGLRDTTD
jgi:hypothetical protein